MRPTLRVLATCLLVLCACTPTGPAGTGGGSAAGGSSGTGGGSGGGSGATGGGSSGTGGGFLPAENCLGKNILMDLGKSSLMVGMTTSHDAVVTQAPWDVQYLYLSAGVPDGTGTCQSCATGCTSMGSNCSNAA